MPKGHVYFEEMTAADAARVEEGMVLVRIHQPHGTGRILRAKLEQLDFADGTPRWVPADYSGTERAG